MQPSPFRFQGPLDPADLRGRDDLVTDLVERVSGRRVTAVLGPRRYGKTSVLRRVAADLEQAGTTVVLVDLYEVSTMADLAVRLDQALADARGRRRDRFRYVVSGEITLGLARVMFSRRSADQPDPLAIVHVLLDALVDVGRRDPLLVVFDEFAGIDRIEGAAGLLRTKLQHHVDTIGILFAGSQPSLMRAMFTDRARPFYAQADLVEIGPLSAGGLQRIVGDRFVADGRDPGRIVGLIHEFTGGHPQRAMQLADAAWRLAEPGAPYTDELWGHALDDVRAQTELANESIFSRSSVNDQKLLRLVAGGKPLFGAAAVAMDLSPGSAQSSRDRLVELGEIMRVGPRWRVVDPIYADWIRHRFPT